MENHVQTKTSWDIGKTAEANLYSSNRYCRVCFLAFFGAFVGTIMTAVGVCLILNHAYSISSLLPNTLLYFKNIQLIGLIILSSGLFIFSISLVMSCLFLVYGKPEILMCTKENDYPYATLPQGSPPPAESQET